MITQQAHLVYVSTTRRQETAKSKANQSPTQARWRDTNRAQLNIVNAPSNGAHDRVLRQYKEYKAALANRVGTSSPLLCQSWSIATQ